MGGDDSSPARKPRRRLLDWKAGVGVAISAALLYVTFRKMDLREVMRELATADPLLFCIAAAVITSVFWIRAWRWKSILAPIAATPFRSRFAAVTIGFMGNNLLPARLGEFMRPYALSRMEPVPLVASFASLIIERLFDGIFVVALLFIAMALPAFPAFAGGDGFAYTGAALVLGGFVAATLIALVALVLMPRRAVAFAERVVMFLPERVRRPIIDALEAFLTGVGVLRNPLLLIRTTGWSAVLWLVNAAGCWVAFRAFGMDLPFAAAIFLQSAIALAVSVPSAPGFIGPYHAMAVFVLGSMWGAEPAAAAAFAVGFHLAGFIPVTLIGLYYAWRLGLSLREVKATEEVVEEAVEEATGADSVIEGRRAPE